MHAWRGGWAGVCALAALFTACSSDAPTLPDPYRGSDARPDASFGDRDLDSGFGNVDPTDVQNGPPPPSQGGDFVDPCAFGSTIGTGIVSGPLAGAEPLLRARATLDRFPNGVPAILQAVQVPAANRLQAHEGGLIASSDQGFFDVRPGSARFYLVQTSTSPNALSGDLDGDGDEDVVSLGFNLSVSEVEDDDGGIGPSQGPFAIFWERADGGLERRARVVFGENRETPPGALADYDGDGDLDVVSSDSNGALRALRNEGGFRFEWVQVPVFAFPKTFVTPSEVFAEDRNGDGKTDIVVIVGGDSTSEAWVFMNDGTGVFAAPVKTPLVAVFGGMTRFGDVTGDGLADLVLRAPDIEIARSLDATRFDEPSRLDGDALGYTLGDVDGDGVLDVATFGLETLSVFLARDSLMAEPLRFAVPSSGLHAVVIHPPAEGGFAQIDALYQAFCREPCGENCEARCIFEACLGCVAHSDCSTDERCVEMQCRPREGSR